jgi:hypothetical protein
MAVRRADRPPCEAPSPPRLIEITNGRCRFAAIRMPQPRLDQSVGAPRIDGLRRTNRLSKTSACRPKLNERSITGNVLRSCPLPCAHGSRTRDQIAAAVAIGGRGWKTRGFAD